MPTKWFFSSYFGPPPLRKMVKIVPPPSAGKNLNDVPDQIYGGGHNNNIITVK